MKNKKRIFLSLTAFILMLSLMVSACAHNSKPQDSNQQTVTQQNKKQHGKKILTYDEKTTVSDEDRAAFFNKTAFVGSSISVGLENYIEYNKESLNIGNPIMLVRESYSFLNDKNERPKYMVQLDGEPMQAKEAIAKSGVKRVFIAMGTNDLYSGVDFAYKLYLEYLNGIIEENPNVEIYIESATSVTNKSENELNSKNINALNEKMKAYCSTQSNMWYVDVTAEMNDESGTLKSEYSSDNYVHLTNSAYELWLNAIIDYCDEIILKRGTIENAVDAAIETDKKWAYEQAQAIVDEQEDGIFKNSLAKKLIDAQN